MSPAGRYLTASFFVAALLLRLLLLSLRGPFLEFDETYYLLIARSLLEGHGYQMNGLPQVAFPPLPAFLYALLGLIWHDMVQAGRLAAALMGAALIFPVGALARRSFGSAAGPIAEGLVVVMPTLMTFAPVPRTYAESLYFGPEPLYLLLFCCAGLALARAFAEGSAAMAAFCGLLAGLTYLTRNEAIAFAPLAALLLLASPRRAVAVPAFLAAFIAVGIHYPIYLHEVSGHWSLSGKVASAVLIREAVSRKVLDDDQRPFEALHYSLDERGAAMRSSYWGHDPAAPPSVSDAALLGISMETMLSNARVVLTRMLPTILPWSIWPLALVGLVFSGIKSPRAGPERPAALLALAAMIVPSLLVCLLLFVEPRHHLYLVPVALVFAAGGIDRIVSIPPLRHVLVRGTLLGALFATLLWTSIQPLVRPAGMEETRRDSERIQMVGARLDTMLPAGEPIMSWHPAIAWHAHRPWFVLPADRLPRIAAYAAGRGVRTIVFETQVHGPPPGGDPGIPFTVFRLEAIPAEALAAGRFELRKIEEDSLLALYRVE